MQIPVFDLLSSLQHSCVAGLVQAATLQVERDRLAWANGPVAVLAKRPPRRQRETVGSIV